MVIGQDALGQLEDQGLRVQPGGLHRIHHLRNQLGPLQLPPVEVDADPHQGRRRVAYLPAAGIARRLLHGPAAKLDDHAAALSDGREVRGGEQTALGMVPSQQRLGTVDRSGFEHHDRLVVEDKLFLGQGTGHVGLELQKVKSRAGEGGVVLDVAGFAFGLCDVHRDVGVSDQFLGRFLPGHQSRDPDTGVDRNLLSADSKRGDELPGDPLRHPGGDVLVLHVLEEHRELVATESSHGIARSER